ncbi:MAG: POTRA domain-containing protein, partial [Thermomonas sp.]
MTKVEVKVSGLDNDVLAANVRTSLSLVDAVGKDISGRRLNYLLREAEAETREALEPFGYYAPTITIQRSDRSASEDLENTETGDIDPDADGEALDISTTDDDARQRRRANRDRSLTVSIHVDPGTPVRIRGFTLGMDGEADNDATVQSAVNAFVPREGDVLDHTLYETSKV